MSKDTLDDLEAVRSVVDALVKFPKEDQQRILRWAQEKLGLAVSTGSPAAPHQADPERKHQAQPAAPGAVLDIKAFIEKKKPASDVQFAAAVAYYHRFEAALGVRKESITADDLQDACRKVGRERMKRPSQTLVNAHHLGLLDRGERGTYTLNTVGENLVAVALPAEGGQPRARPGGKRKSKGKKSRGKANTRAKRARR